MRQTDIRTTMNVYGDAATADMREAHEKVVRLALPAVMNRGGCKCFNSGVGDGNRTRNVRSHSPVLCQLSYSHRV
jgi:hypothetical protein